MSTNRGKGKEDWYILAMGDYSAIKRNKIMPFAVTRMDLETVTLSEGNQTEKEKYHDIAFMWNLKKWYK